MTDYTWPSSVVPTSASLTWLDNTVTFISPLSGTTRTETRPGGRWRLTLTVQNLKNLTGADDPIHELEAYLYKLNGAANRAVIPDFAYTRSGPGGGTPRVMGAGQSGLLLVTDGWPNSTVVLYAGDRFGLNDQMLVCADNVTSNSLGQASINLAHPLRAAVADNTGLEINSPTARYILTNKPSFASVPGVFKTVMVEFEESIL